jgi:hypothetical protein
MIALHSPSGIVETGLHGCPQEKKGRRLAGGVERAIFSGPVFGAKVAELWQVSAVF